MNARFLLAFFDSVYVLALTAWVGSNLFFSFGVAPLVFQVLSPEAGAKFVRALFPRYYTWGAIAGAIALPAYLGVPLSFQEFRGPIVALQALMIVAGTLIMLYAANSLTPAINAARDAGPTGQALFDRLHRRSVWLNVVVLAVGIILLIALVNRPEPRTAGIVEPTPLERARSEYKQMRIREEASRTTPAPRPQPTSERGPR
ncbi:DUF4149 domain-containing protein [Singulisphaera acidiphila]|uniref:Putative integral membrane protein n=1 Tax=Singulisphaera acidiphila (strain ATCC BAA-1392 / DSM 18658 / VKM B-2454 / MOB10) TaxID=886293 RepID=L0DGM4_SINAD|nr:DUF4149 domain-containing protein [Singulisphaera acidiphila]AGA28000.1 putative integral membrane protein [Singulisphaera acidiphila DSM 18658]